MPEPVTLTVISAAAAVVGAVQGVYSATSGDSGFHVSDSSVHYPAQLEAQYFAHPGHSINRDIMTFESIGMLYDGYFAVTASGYVSNDDGPLTAWVGTDDENIPANRFLHLSFDKSGSSENMSRGLLNVDIEPWGGTGRIAEGDPDDPWIALRVSGRFDPVGHGDMEFAFKLLINTFGRLELPTSEIEYRGTSGDFDISLRGDRVEVKLNQPLLGQN